MRTAQVLCLFGSLISSMASHHWNLNSRHVESTLGSSTGENQSLEEGDLLVLTHAEQNFYWEACLKTVHGQQRMNLYCWLLFTLACLRWQARFEGSQSIEWEIPSKDCWSGLGMCWRIAVKHGTGCTGLGELGQKWKGYLKVKVTIIAIYTLETVEREIFIWLHIATLCVEQKLMVVKRL
jgi:hypothetical protein